LNEDEFLRMLLSEERKAWQNPRDILLRLGLTSGQRFLDVASGPGFFAVEASKIVGKTGYVYCVDASTKAAEVCAQNLSQAGYKNFEVIAQPIEIIQLPTVPFDVALVANVLHDFENPVLVLRKVYGSLRRGGVLGVVDWKKIETPFGPPLSIRLSVEESIGIVEGSGFRVLEVENSYPYHYLIKAEKADA
jgi:ubiquinone/menaquinone biosynthesis C-methylase UbiE